MHKLVGNLITDSTSISTSILLYGEKGLYQEDDALELAISILNTNDKKLYSHPDFLYVSCGKDKSMGVDVAEQIISKSAYMPTIADKIVVLISEIDRMTEQAQNKLLKTIEESQHVIVIATAYTNNVLKTIKSRCRLIQYKPYTEQEFNDFCHHHNIQDSETLFFVTNGCPGLVSECDDVLSIFKAVSDAINGDDFVSVLNILHMVEEKDSAEFCSKYPNHVRNLLAMMHSCFTKKLLAKSSDVDGIDKINMILRNLEDHISMCPSSMYTKGNFFLCIAKIIQIVSLTGQKEEKYE